MTGTSSASPSAGTARSGSNGLAIAGLVCGIVGLFVLNIILGPLAVIFGGIGLSRANRGAGKRAVALAAVVLGVVDVILFAVLLAVAAHHGFSWHAGG